MAGSDTDRSVLLSGAERVTGIVGRSKSFADVVAKKVPGHFASAVKAKDGVSGRSYSAYLSNARPVVRTYTADAAAEVLFFGKTINNLKEQEFLQEVLDLAEAGLVVRNFGQHFTELEEKKHISASLAPELIEELFAWLDARTLTVPQLWQVHQFVATFSAFRSTFVRRPDLLPKLAAVANDHSPGQVAFKAAMEAAGLPVVYLQHAAVTPSFPPLDYDVSILRDPLSKQIYQRSRGKLFVISREARQDGLSRLAQGLTEAHDNVDVGIYPTSTFEPAVVLAVCRALSKNPHVRSVFTKLHPNSGIKIDDQTIEELRATNEWSHAPHVAIVGNSSASVELLTKGIPVYQLFELDDVEDDYYGFVRHGIAARTSLSAIEHEQFWKDGFYGNAWRERARLLEQQSPDLRERSMQRAAQHIFALRRPSLFKRAAKSLRGAAELCSYTHMNTMFRRTVMRFLAIASASFARRHPVAARTAALASQKQFDHQDRSADAHEASAFRNNLLRTLLAEQEEPEILANALLRSGVPENTLAVMDWFNEAWARRDPVIYGCVERLHNTPSFPIDAWLQLALSEISASPLFQKEASEVIERVRHIKNTRLRRLYRQKALSAFLRNGRLDDIFSLAEASRTPLREAVSGNNLVSFARLITVEGRADRASLLQELIASASSYDRLKLCAAGLLEGFEGHEALIDGLLSVAHPSLARDVSELVVPVYRDLGRKLCFADVRRDATEREKLQELILNAVVDGKPFSALRLGDGEAYIFDEMTGPFTAGDRAMRERHWWNRELDPGLREELKRRTLAAFQDADLVGIPTIHRFIRDFASGSQSLVASTANRGIVTAARGALQLSEVQKFTEERVHNVIFHPEYVNKLVARAPRLVVVAGVIPAHIEHRFGSLTRQLSIVQLPSHARTAAGRHYNVSYEPLPLIFDRIQADFCQVVRAGDLVLVSGGIAAKSLVDTAKQAGAIGIDIGGQLEVLVGLPNGPVG